MRAAATSQHVSLEHSESKPGTGWGRGAETTASPLPPQPHAEQVEASSHGLPKNTLKNIKFKKKKKLFVTRTALRVNLRRAEVNERGGELDQRAAR